MDVFSVFPGEYVMFSPKKTMLVAFVSAVFLVSAVPALSLTTAFGPQELVGAPGLFGSAAMSIDIVETTPNGGIVEFSLTNTSPLTELEPDRFANAFITEFQFNPPSDYEPVYAASSVIARVGVRYAQGAGNPVVATNIDRILDWDFGVGSGGGLYARANEASQNSNNNAIFSANALDISGVPVEDYAEGFLENGWDGGVFDTIVFRVEFVDSVPISEDDLLFYACDDLTLKFQGGNGSAWVPNHCVPEPFTAVLAAVGVIAVLLRRRLG